MPTKPLDSRIDDVDMAARASKGPDDSRGRSTPRSADITVAATALALIIAALLCYMNYQKVEGLGSIKGLFVGLLIAGLAVASLLVAPQKLPYFASAYLPFNLSSPFTPSSASFLNMTNFLMALLFLAWLKLRGQQPKRPFTALDRGLILLLALAFSSHTLASFQHGDLSIAGFLIVYKRWVSPYLMYFMVGAILRDRRDVRAVLTVILGTAFLVGVLSWVDGDRHARGGVDASRIGGILTQPNSLGAFLAYYGVPLLAVALTATPLPLRAAAVGALGVVIKGLQYTFSRGSNLAVLVGMVALLLARGPHYLVGAAAVTWAAMTAVPELVPESAIGRMRSTTGRDSSVGYDDGSAVDVDDLDSSSRNRLYVWDAAFAMMRDHPFLGVGLQRFDSFSHDYMREAGIDPVALGVPVAAHNAFILMAAEFGLPALVCIVFVLLCLGVRGLRWYSHESNAWERCLGLSVFAMVVTITVSSIFGSRMSDEALMCNFWLLAATVPTSPRRRYPSRRRPMRGLV